MSLTECTISEEAIDGFSRTNWVSGVDRRPSVFLAQDLARLSRRLQHFAASFAIDAQDFFKLFFQDTSVTKAEVAGNWSWSSIEAADEWSSSWSSLETTEDWSWSSLETLALTSILLTSPRQSEDDINHLLEAASLAVRKMPRLHTMEIWNGNGNEHACFFRYSYDPDSRRASLTWKGTWAIDITESTADSWAETVRQRTAFEAEIQIEKLEVQRPFMTEAVARFLKLRDRVATLRVSRFLPSVASPFEGHYAILFAECSNLSLPYFFCTNPISRH